MANILQREKEMRALCGNEKIGQSFCVRCPGDLVNKKPFSFGKIKPLYAIAKHCLIDKFRLTRVSLTFK